MLLASVLLVNGVSFSNLSCMLHCYNYVAQNKEKSIVLKTMEDGQVMLYSVSSLSLAALVFPCGITLNFLFNGI